MNFNFGTPKTTGGLSFTTPTTAAVATPTLGLAAGDNKGIGSANQTPAKTPAFGLSFGTPATSATGFSFGATNTSAPTLNFGTPTTATGFGLGTPASTAAVKTPALGGFSLTTPTSAPTSAPTLGTSTGLMLGTPATTASTGFSLGSTLAAPATTTSAPLFGGLGSTSLVSTTTTISTGFTLGKPATTTTTAVLGTTTSTLTSQPAATTPPPINFNQIEEVLNKWTLEMEEQGKVFINQALQLNAWDRLVIANGEKIQSLNNGIEKVKLQQQQLDHELEFVLIQQRELEECIAPLEKELQDIPIQDHDRNLTYQMAENMDTQLKQMSEDLKEIIEHLNEANRSEDTNDPVSQISRILNAHMNSLQWIDRNTAQISTVLDQITKMHDVHRRENERSFHLTYE